MSRMPAELGSMPCAQRAWKGEPRQRQSPQDTQRLWGEEQFKPRTNWCRGRRWWADACETLVWPRGIRHLAVGSDRHCRCARCFWCAEFLPCYCLADEEIEALRSLSSWNLGGGAYDNSTYRKTGKGKSISKRQRPTMVNTGVWL